MKEYIRRCYENKRVIYTFIKKKFIPYTDYIDEKVH